jgi:aminoglycoside 6-adenylyltransferase
MYHSSEQKDLAIRRQLIDWGAARADVRAMILTSTRCNPSAHVDAFSDYDLIIAVEDIQPYLSDESWLHDFGDLLVVYRDPVRSVEGRPQFARITQYWDNKIDFTVLPIETLRRMAWQARNAGSLPPDLDVGYTVLLDKDGLTTGMPAPNYQAFIPAPPDKAEYQRVIEEFFHEGTYLAKNLWRRQLLPVKYFLDAALKQDNLRLMLEWRVEIEHGWGRKTGVLGKGLQAGLPPDLWTELERTYVGADWDENWTAFFQTVELFSKVASQVGAQLGYAYPDELHRRCVEHYRLIQALPQDAKTYP